MNQTELGFGVWSFWCSLHPKPYIDRGFGHRFVRAFFPWDGIAEFKKSIRNIFILVAQALNTTATGLEEQQRITDNLAEVVLQNCGALDLLANQQGGTCALLGDESCFYVNKSDKVIQLLEILEKNGKILE